MISIEPVIDYSVRNLCYRRYHGHPRGCPNFDRRKSCPPQAPKFEDVFDMDGEFFLISNCFNLAAHVTRMRNVHPNWTERQLRCCLYWQGKARVELEETITFCKKVRPHLVVSRCPEALGINVTETCKRAGIILEWPPDAYAYQIAIAGMAKRRI